MWIQSEDVVVEASGESFGGWGLEFEGVVMRKEEGGGGRGVNERVDKGQVEGLQVGEREKV